MPSVTLHPPGAVPAETHAPAPETPTQRVVKAANALRYVTDEQGRTIGWRKLNALEDFDLTEIAGANAGNQEWMLRATIAFGVREIDGDPVSRPANKNQLRAMVARLDDAGMSAILGMFSGGAGGDESEQDEMDRAKNSAGTPASG